jgi:hypothetical protein
MAESESNPSKFEQKRDEKPVSLIGEFVHFIVEYKAWWMIPIILCLGLIALLVALAPTGAAPFIYTLF